MQILLKCSTAAGKLAALLATRTTTLSGILVFSLVLGCSSGPEELHVYTWASYIKPELITRFEAENNVRVVIDTFDSNESMYAKLKAGATGYDVMFPSSYMLRVLREQGMIQELQRSLLPNIKHIDPKYLAYTNDTEMRYSVPYMISSSGIGILKSKVADFSPSWAVFDRQDLKGRLTILNDMRESIGAALKFLGYSVNSLNDDELEKAKQVLLRWKKNIAKFESEQYKNGLAAGEFLAVHGYSGDILQAQGDNPDVEYVLPKEGTTVAADGMVIPAASGKVKLAHAFINFLHLPPVAAENIEFVQYLCPNEAAYSLVDGETRNNTAIFLSDEVLRSSETIQDLGEGNAKYTKVWDEVKAAQ